MRKLFLGASTAVLIAGPASAADLAVKAPGAPAYIASPWDGLYVGANVGGGQTDFSVTARRVSTSQNDTGVVGGFQVGYNKQYGNIVIGVESDIDLTSIKGTTGGITTELPWFGTTRGRAGILVTPSVLLYGTGGVAYGHAEVSGPGFSLKLPGVGWAAGAGFEYALGGGFMIGAEYLHVDFDGPSSSAGTFSGSVRANTDIGRARLNYKF